jgi:sphingolipid delta-4 desaturase
MGGRSETPPPRQAPAGSNPQEEEDSSAVEATLSYDNKDRDYIIGDDEEPHATRRFEILKKYPEIKKLMGFEWRTKYIVLASVLLQIAMARLSLNWSWGPFLVLVYVVGATAQHSLFLAIHEIAHNLGARSANANKLIGMMANLPIYIPYSTTFKPYHMDHHRNQGVDGIDVDVATRLEGWIITGSATCYVDHTLRKAVFMFFQIFAYALRPGIMKPSGTNFDRWMALNYLVQFSFDGLMVAWLGFHGSWYFLLSTFFAGSIHPTAGHFIAEHYVMEGKTETYSYYGILNYLAYNVGYHNEHHDFPNIAWSGLPKVREIAPEFYNDLPQCASWPGVLLRYIFDDSISPYSRVKRQPRHLKGS